MSELRDAVSEWVAAEYEFRLGVRSYCTETQDRLVRAEEQLRKALTGKRLLRNAARKLSTCDVDGDEKRIEQWQRKRSTVKPSRGSLSKR